MATGTAPTRPARAWWIGVYFGALSLTSGLGDPTGLVSLPILFILKDQLLLGPQAVAVFEAVTLVPHYLAFFFGILRDRWSPFGRGDRGHLLLSAPVVILCYLWLSAASLSYPVLLVAIVLAMFAFQMIDTAAQSLMTAIARRTRMTGRLSALVEIMESVVGAAAMLAGGWMADHVSPSAIFLVAAVVTAAVFAQGFWRPVEVFEASDEAPVSLERVGQTLRTLGRNRAFRLTAAALVLYNFSPGWGTPLLYYLTDDVSISAEAYGAVRAVTFGAVAVVTVLYGFLCLRYPLKHLLRWAILLNVFPGFLFLVIRTPEEAVAVAAAIGLLGGFANIALFDLLMRACPNRLEGTAGMLGVSAFGVAGAGGDLLGAWLYDQGGFVVCLALDAVATALMLPLILRLPSRITEARDGEAFDQADASSRERDASSGSH